MESPSPLAGASKVTKNERIEALEQRVVILEALVASLTTYRVPYSAPMWIAPSINPWISSTVTYTSNGTGALCEVA